MFQSTKYFVVPVFRFFEILSLGLNLVSKTLVMLLYSHIQIYCSKVCSEQKRKSLNKTHTEYSESKSSLKIIIKYNLE